MMSDQELTSASAGVPASTEVAASGLAVVSPEASSSTEVAASGKKQKKRKHVQGETTEAKKSKKARRGATEPAAGKAAKPARASKSKARKPGPVYELPKAMTAFFLFQQDVRPGLQQDNPGITFGGLAKKVAELWHASTEDTKKPYVEAAARAKLRKQRVQAALPQPPVAPKDAYQLFAAVRGRLLRRSHPGCTTGELQSLVGSQWAEADAAERAPFEAEADDTWAAHEVATAAFAAAYPLYGKVTLEALLASVGYAETEGE